LQHWQYGKRWLLAEGKPELLFSENETNNARLFGTRNRSPYVKDAFHEYLIHQNKGVGEPGPERYQDGCALSAERSTGPAGDPEAAPDRYRAAWRNRSQHRASRHHYFAWHQERTQEVPGTNDFGAGFDRLFELRKAEADEFFATRIPAHLSDDAKNVTRQAVRGHAVVEAVLSLRCECVAGR
jgi:hypothetical protein